MFARYLGQIADRVRGFGGNPDQAHPSPSGEGRPVPEPPPEPEYEKLDSITGRISRIFYDCSGKFEGFVIATCDGDRRFRTCLRGIEEIVRKACRDDLRVTIWFRDREVKRIAINCC